MADALVVAELTEDGKVRKTTHSAIAMAKQALPALGGSFSILVLGATAKGAAQELTGFGAAKVLVCEDPSLTHYVAEQYAPRPAQAGQGGVGLARLGTQMQPIHAFDRQPGSLRQPPKPVHE